MSAVVIFGPKPERQRVTDYDLRRYCLRWLLSGTRKFSLSSCNRAQSRQPWGRLLTGRFWSGNWENRRSFIGLKAGIAAAAAEQPDLADCGRKPIKSLGG